MKTRELEDSNQVQPVCRGTRPKILMIKLIMSVALLTSSSFAIGEQRKKIIEEAAEQRYVEFAGGETRYTSGTVDELNENSTAPPQK